MTPFSFFFFVFASLALFPHLAFLVIYVVTRCGGIGSLLCSAIETRADRTTSSWSSRSWLDKLGRDTRKGFFSFTAWERAEETRVIDLISYNGDFSWNMELFNADFKKKITFIAAVRIQTWCKSVYLVVKTGSRTKLCKNVAFWTIPIVR